MVLTGWFDIHGTWVEYDEPLVVESKQVRVQVRRPKPRG